MKHLTEKQVLGPILEVLVETMPRDNLLSSACLELFEFVKKENIKELVKHLVQNYRELLVSLSYVDTFRDLILRYDQTQGFTNMEYFTEGADDEAARKVAHPNARLMEHIAIDPSEEEYWNTSDDEEEQQAKTAGRVAVTNGSTATPKPLVDYPSDEEPDENVDPEVLPTSGEDKPSTGKKNEIPAEPESVRPMSTPPERISEKRRREEDDDDELGKLMQNKRRNSSSANSNASATSGGPVRRKKSFSGTGGGGGAKKIAITISSAAVKTGGTARSDEES